MLISLRSCQLNTPNSVCVYIHIHCVTYRSLDHMPPLHNHRTLALMLSLYYIFILRWGGMLWNTTLNTHSPAFIDSAFVIDRWSSLKAIYALVIVGLRFLTSLNSPQSKREARVSEEASDERLLASLIDIHIHIRRYQVAIHHPSIT